MSTQTVKKTFQVKTTAWTMNWGIAAAKFSTIKGLLDTAKGNPLLPKDTEINVAPI